METHAVTRKGQVTIPKELCKQLGIHEGSPVDFRINGDCLEIRVRGERPMEMPRSGFGLVKANQPSVPADFDPAGLLTGR
jgi:AbrB family looped-hinge helix DNA binding protein